MKQYKDGQQCPGCNQGILYRKPKPKDSATTEYHCTWCLGTYLETWGNEDFDNDYHGKLDEMKED